MGATKQILVSLTSISIFRIFFPIVTKPPQLQQRNPLIVRESPVYPQNIYHFVYSAHFSTNKKNNWHNLNIIWIVMGMVTLSLFSRKYCSHILISSTTCHVAELEKLEWLLNDKILRLGRLYNTYFPLLMRHTWVFVSFNSVFIF